MAGASEPATSSKQKFINPARCKNLSKHFTIDDNYQLMSGFRNKLY